MSVILLAQDFRYDLMEGLVCWMSIHPFADWMQLFRNPRYSIAIFLGCFFCFLATFIVLQLVHPKIPINVREVKYIPAELMSYTLPYVVSFMSLDYQETGKFVGILIFLVWIFLITHRSGQLILNPLLIVFGWKLFEVKYTYAGHTGEYVGRGLSKRPLEPGDRCQHAIVQDVMIFLPVQEDEGE